MTAVVHDDVPILTGANRKEQEEATVEDSEVLVFVDNFALSYTFEHKLTKNR